MSTQPFKSHSTSLVYSKKTGRVLHISHVEAAEGTPPPREILSELENNIVDEVCRVHRVPRDEVAVIPFDPGKFNENVTYTVDVATGTVSMTSRPESGHHSVRR